MFNDKDVIKIYRGKEFNKIPKDKLMEILHNFSSSEKDQKRLATWKKHFEDQGIPYTIIQVKDHDGKAITKSIWKERLV
jgi:hypothetical protein